MNWRQTMLVGTLLVTGLGLWGCGEDLPVLATEPEPVVLVIPYDNDLAEDGLEQYINLCMECHKSQGLEQSGNITPILQTVYGTESAIAQDGLAHRIARTMPEGETGSCDLTCGLEIQEYFYRLWTENYLNPPSEEEAVTEEERDSRVEAGRLLYQSNSCFVCHGAGGEGGLGGALTSTSLDYLSLASTIEIGMSGTTPAMPACTPNGNCASQIADYVWVEFIGGTLTENGGIR